MGKLLKAAQRYCTGVWEHSKASRLAFVVVVFATTVAVTRTLPTERPFSWLIASAYLLGGFVWVVLLVWVTTGDEHG